MPKAGPSRGKLQKEDIRIKSSRRIIVGGESVPIITDTDRYGNTRYSVPIKPTEEDVCRERLLSLYEGRTPRNY